jgi:hypothetical protein
MRDGPPDPFPLCGTPEWDKMIYENQTAILEWLRSRWHEIDDGEVRKISLAYHAR